MRNRKDRYEDYTGFIFRYKYPFTWRKRSKNYLQTLPERDFKEEQDFMFPRDEDDVDWYDLYKQVNK